MAGRTRSKISPDLSSPTSIPEQHNLPKIQGEFSFGARIRIEEALRSLRGERRNREFGTFNRYLWAFVDGKLIVNAPRSLTDLPAETALSRTLSKDLVKRGFRFVGPKIVLRSCHQLTRVSSTKTFRYFTSSLRPRFRWSGLRTRQRIVRVLARVE